MIRILAALLAALCLVSCGADHLPRVRCPTDCHCHTKTFAADHFHGISAPDAALLPKMSLYAAVHSTDSTGYSRLKCLTDDIYSINNFMGIINGGKFDV